MRLKKTYYFSSHYITQANAFLSVLYIFTLVEAFSLFGSLDLVTYLLCHISISLISQYDTHTGQSLHSEYLMWEEEEAENVKRKYLATSSLDVF